MAGGVRFTVYRLAWAETPDGRWYYVRRDRAGTHESADAADAHRRAIEAEVRPAVNPFGCVGAAPFEQTSLPEFALRDWLQDAGLDPPPAGATTSDWRVWWAARAPAWTDAQRDHAWEALDRVRFAEVEARPAGPVVYAVVESAEWYNDEWNTVNESITVAYRSRDRADAECAKRNAAAMARPEPDADAPPTYRVVELDAEGLP